MPVLPPFALMPFVILHHVTPEGSSRPGHWDVMIEDPARATPENPVEHRLWTWALDDLAVLEASASSVAKRDAVICQRLADHRAAYLTYEGELSGNRGHVTRWDSGSCRIEQLGLDARSELVLLVVTLSGARVRGTLRLQPASLEVRASGAGEAETPWLLSWDE